MTREQAKQVLIGMGIEEPSDEQVTKYLDSVTGEVKKEKDKNTSIKEKADKAEALQKELDELKQQNMTDAEKAELERQKEKAANEKRISDLETALANSQKEALTGKITSIFAMITVMDTVRELGVYTKLTFRNLLTVAHWHLLLITMRSSKMGLPNRRVISKRIALILAICSRC